MPQPETQSTHPTRRGLTGGSDRRPLPRPECSSRSSPFDCWDESYRPRRGPLQSLCTGQLRVGASCAWGLTSCARGRSRRAHRPSDAGAYCQRVRRATRHAGSGCVGRPEGALHRLVVDDRAAAADRRLSGERGPSRSRRFQALRGPGRFARVEHRPARPSPRAAPSPSSSTPGTTSSTTAAASSTASALTSETPPPTSSTPTRR